jgi:NDP-sugar pyrophosphorylase family protein
VEFSRERAILGTAGGLKKAAKHFQGEPFYLVNSDSLTDADLTSAAAAHAESGRAATLIVRRHDPAGGYRPVGVAASGGAGARLIGIAGRRWGRDDAMQRTFTGIHVLEPSVLEAIPPATACDINADIYPWLLDENPESVGTWLHEGWWSEAGSPARYLELNLETLDRSGRDAVVGPLYRIDPEARVSRSVIGSGVRLAPGAVVEDCVLWDDVTVGEGISLARCIVTHGVEVPMLPPAETILMHDEDGELIMRALGGSA